MEEFSGLIEAVGPFAAYITSIAWLAHILVNTATLAWPKRPAWVPPLLVILLSAALLWLLAGATVIPLTAQAFYQLVLAALLAGVSAMLSRTMDNKATEAKRQSDWEDSGQIEELAVVSDDPRSRYMSPEEEEDDTEERRIGFTTGASEPTGVRETVPAGR